MWEKTKLTQKKIIMVRAYIYSKENVYNKHSIVEEKKENEEVVVKGLECWKVLKKE